MNRRHFIKLLAGGQLALAMSGMPRIALSAAAPVQKKLLVVFQRFANDGHNTFVPHTESKYYDRRPTLAIAEPSDADLNAAIDINGMELDGTTFGLHPRMGTFKPLWDAGDIALFPATHVGDNANRSHFFSQDFIEKGIHRDVDISVHNDGTGWLSRWMQARYGNPEGIQLFGFSTDAKSLRGNFPALILSNPSDLDLGGGLQLNSPLTTLLRERIAAGFGTMSHAHAWGQHQEKVYTSLDQLDNLDFAQATQNGAVYPGSQLGRELRQAAILIRGVPEIEVITVDTGGFDTHSNQGAASGAHANLIGNFSDSIAAFYQDMGDQMNDIAVVVMSEFGRTLDENGRGGTDHGWANAWWVLSKGITGGMYGSWPGLDDANIGQVGSRFMLNPALDYRDILAKLLINHMGSTIGQAEQAFPGYTFNDSLNFI